MPSPVKRRGVCRIDDRVAVHLTKVLVVELKDGTRVRILIGVVRVVVVSDAHIESYHRAVEYQTAYRIVVRQDCSVAIDEFAFPSSS